MKRLFPWIMLCAIVVTTACQAKISPRGDFIVDGANLYMQVGSTVCVTEGVAKIEGLDVVAGSQLRATTVLTLTKSATGAYSADGSFTVENCTIEATALPTDQPTVVPTVEAQPTVVPTVDVQPTTVPTVDAHSPVDDAVGGPASSFIRDQTEGACNETFNPQTLYNVVTQLGVHVAVQVHNGPEGWRCVLVIEDATVESQIHTLTGTFTMVTEIAAVAPSLDKIAPNPANLQGCLDNNRLINLYTGGAIAPDQNKVDQTICD